MSRYELLEKVPEVKDASELRKKTVTIVGLGSIGSAVAESLARIGINLRIIDKDRVYEEDLPALSLFTEEHLQKFKAKEAKKILEQINKEIKIKAFHEQLTETNAFLVESDLIIETTGSMETALIVDKAAKKKPLIYARAKGTKAIVYLATETRLKDAKKFFEKEQPEGEGIIRSTAQIIAGLIVNKAIKILTGQKVEKNCLEVDTWKYSMNKVTVRKDRK